MKMTSGWLELRTRHTFTIARGGSAQWKNVELRLEDGGLVGRGEGAPRSYYAETPEAALSWLEARASAGGLPAAPEELRRESGPASARCALDLALHDLWAQRDGVALHEWLASRYGLRAQKRWPRTSFTIGIDAPDKVREKTLEAASYPILKVKLGSSDDLALLAAIRSVSKAVLRVDANAAWTVEQTLDLSSRLVELGIELIEQPLPKHDLEGYRALRGRVQIPIYADESCVGPEDVEKLADAVDGINIKLSKCGGLEPACRMIQRARELGLHVMVGCFIESSLGITAAAHLAPFVDVLDLDGAALLAEDPYSGATIPRGEIHLPDARGIGAVPTAARG
ncbi:MAG: dipeptide epimerase [Planctomycetes bacterium]|nr:dipeptide epimerase [Planctomycetota bacterium]